MELQIGKVPNDILNRLVIGKYANRSERMVLSPGVGEDFGVLDFGDEYCVVSGDPITGATKQIGKYAVQIACNDIATCGVKPIAVLTTLLLPPGVTEAELGGLIDEIAHTADTLDVCVIGGHTEVTDAVNRIVVSVTAIGAAKRGQLIITGGALDGDALVMTKSAAIEGASILASEREAELTERFGKEPVESIKKLSDNISVVEEGVIAGSFGAHAMHDVTEGGVLGAAWEMAEASGKGIIVRSGEICVLDETRAVCEYLGVDPLRLISSGSMLIATEKPDELIDLLNDAGIFAKKIAIFTKNPEERLILDREGNKAALGQPGPDELYNALNT